MATRQTVHEVILHHCPDYGQQSLNSYIDSSLTDIFADANFNGKSVLLKPNLISGRGPSFACTNPHFTEAAARCFLDRGARVKVGDSPAFGSAKGVMAKQGLLPVFERMNVELVNFRTPVGFTLGTGVKVEIAGEALDCDYLVNLPKLKAHNQMYVTGAVKNLFGTVAGVRKAMMHMRNGSSHREFSDILIRLPNLLPPHISIMDAIEAMHGSGPLDGDPLQLGCIAASRCPVALDTAMLALLELPFEKSPLWSAAFKMELSGAAMENHHYPADCPEDFKDSGFVAPSALNPIRFNPVRFMVSGLRRFALAFRS